MKVFTMQSHKLFYEIVIDGTFCCMWLGFTLTIDRHETIVAERCETFRNYCIVGVSG